MEINDNNWRLQVFGDRGRNEQAEADIISAIDFDSTGDFLATGDRGGRVVLFEADSSKKGLSYNFYKEFQSHEPEFDYLKSLEIEEKINKVKWLKRKNTAQFLLSTNGDSFKALATNYNSDKTIKLWKVSKQPLVSINGYNTMDELGRKIDHKHIHRVQIPQLVIEETQCTVFPRKVYSHGHQYHINALSINSDGETYLSADDLRVNLWHFDNYTESFNIVDIKPPNMEELSQVITSAEFHPSACNLFIYSTSKGYINMCDLRDSSLCDKHTSVYVEKGDSPPRTFFSEIVASVSDAKFSQDGRYIIARDFLTVKVWDVNMNSAPVAIYSVHDHLRSRLCDLYENDCIFDKFECTSSKDNRSIVTGSYNNNFRVFGKEGVSEIRISPKTNKKKAFFSTVMLREVEQRQEDMELVDFSQKVLHAAWHPSKECIAVAATNHLYMFLKD